MFLASSKRCVRTFACLLLRSTDLVPCVTHSPNLFLFPGNLPHKLRFLSAFIFYSKFLNFGFFQLPQLSSFEFSSTFLCNCSNLLIFRVLTVHEFIFVTCENTSFIYCSIFRRIHKTYNSHSQFSTQKNKQNPQYYNLLKRKF